MQQHGALRDLYLVTVEAIFSFLAEDDHLYIMFILFCDIISFSQKERK